MACPAIAQTEALTHMAFKPIQIVINAKDDASAVLNRLGRNVKLLGATIAGYFGVKAFAGVVQSAADFEAAMSRVKAATEGSAAEMAALTNAAQAAGSNTKYTSVQAAGALENLAKAGLNAGDAIKTLPAVLALAQAGDLELGTASEYVTKAVMGMGLAFDDAGRVADVLAKGANATNTSVEGLAQALSYAAPVANTLGVSLESTVAIIGKFADAGIDASRAGTALNSIMSQFANPLSHFRKELGAAGIVTTNFEEALHQLAAKGKDGERAINAVGLESGPALRALLNQGMGALDELTGKLKDAGGSADATAKTMADNLNGSLKGLSSMWETVTQVLGKPVLPVVRQGVDDLASALRKAVDGGLVERFGKTLATAFENGLKFFREFAANVNFDAVVLRLQVFASETGETLQRIGQYATNAGNSVQLAWGVMTAGVNGVMAIVYKVGEAFAGVASNIQSGLAMLLQGLAKITFGEMSQSFARAAEEMRLSAEATWASSEALAAKSDASFQAMAAGAQTARDAWGGLTGEISAVGNAAAAAAPSIEAVAAGIESTGKAASKAAKDAKAKAEADRLATEAIKQLRAEYDKLIAGGNLDAAGRKLQEIDKIQQQLAGSAQDAATATALIDQARSAFDRLEKDGKQPPLRIAEAWKSMADKVIAANGGIAPKWLKTQASVKGFELALDDAGKAVTNTDKATSRAVSNMVSGLDKVRQAAEGAQDGMQGVEHASGRAAAASREWQNGGPRNFVEERNAGVQGSQGIMHQNTGPLNLVPQFQSRKELDAWWQAWKDDYAKMNPFMVKSSGALGNYQFDLTQFAVNEAGKSIDMQEAVNKARESEKPRHEQTQATGPKSGRGRPGGIETLPSVPSSAAPAVPAPAVGPAPAQQVITHRHEINVGGRQFAIGTDAQGSDQVQQMLQALERSAQLSGGMH